MDQKTNPLPLFSVFLVLACAVVASVAGMFVMGRAVFRSNDLIERKQVVIDHLRETMLTMGDAETGQRGFLLTQNPDYLAPYTAALNQSDQRIRGLRALTVGDDLPVDEVERYESLAKAKLAELKETIAAAQADGLAAAAVIVNRGTGKEIMDQIRALSASMIAREKQQIDAERRRSSRLSNYRTWSFAAVAVIDLIFLWWAYRRIAKATAASESAARVIRDQKELLEVTLASIGDGVIVTDADARVTFLNGTAEQLTGWTTQEARGLPCVTVFNIVNETTGLLVESPVDKVLRLGSVVALANHTLLIRKNGEKIPIDDSGAPIRRADGEIKGVVLVFRDFSDHKNSERELRAAMEEAQGANIAKDNFLANLSHELRTPLTPVAATLAIWESDQVLPPHLAPDLEMMRRNVNLEARLIDDLLDLTRIVRGKLTLNPEVADINELLRSVAGMYQSEIQSKRLTFKITSLADLHHVYADPARLQQVFWNVLKNATKFTPEGGHIAIEILNQNTGNVEVKIQDDGIGMSSAVLEKLFLPFEQGADEVVKRYGGLGLGMAISKALMEAQGGNIQAESPGPGQGSTFVISLPAVAAPPVQTQTPPTQEPRKVQKKLNVLVVEDNEDTARVLGRLIGRWGHRVRVCSTVTAAKEAVDTDSFEVILSDIGLPDGTGVDLIRHVRTKSTATAIALSGYGMDADIAECREAGFDDHLTKPINLQRLELLIAQISESPA